ncbi:hypothetical protein FA13DRAFT_1709167 [Coprinellus micaceus]|uniref:Uncharacterized protein n=1 Tax=Coprinellus micaceus TaxID=71717 RepID=A0A4Y7TD67_COPMI|nr:hypothetical protein FA13DRAFT_1709167 [Coprinellus micaceus]
MILRSNEVNWSRSGELDKGTEAMNPCSGTGVTQATCARQGYAPDSGGEHCPTMTFQIGVLQGRDPIRPLIVMPSLKRKPSQDTPVVRDGKKLRSIAEPSSNAEISDVVEETEAVGSVEEKENNKLMIRIKRLAKKATKPFTRRRSSRRSTVTEPGPAEDLPQNETQEESVEEKSQDSPAPVLTELAVLEVEVLEDVRHEPLSQFAPEPVPQVLGTEAPEDDDQEPLPQAAAEATQPEVQVSQRAVRAAKREVEKEAGGGASWKLVAESKKKKREAIREAKAKAARDSGAPWARERPEGGLNAKGLKKLPADYRLVLPDSSRNVDVASGVTCDFPNAKDDKVYQCSDWVVEALSGASGETQVNARLSKAVDSNHTSEDSDTDSD